MNTSGRLLQEDRYRPPLPLLQQECLHNCDDCLRAAQLVGAATPLVPPPESLHQRMKSSYQQHTTPPFFILPSAGAVPGNCDDYLRAAQLVGGLCRAGMLHVRNQ